MKAVLLRPITIEHTGISITMKGNKIIKHVPGTLCKISLGEGSKIKLGENPKLYYFRKF